MHSFFLLSMENIKSDIPLVFGILAYPASHSLSPALHTAGFLQWGIPAVYKRFEISPSTLAEFFAQNVRTQKISGLSVSVPYKEVVLPYLDVLEDSAKKIGAVNTIFWKNGKLVGENTDWKGFFQSLTHEYDPREKTAVVLGAGGATRAILYALEKANIGKIFLWNRTPEKAQKCAQEFVNVQTISSDSFPNPEDIDLVINTTSLGMQGPHKNESAIPKNFWKSHHTAFDIVYTPRITKFLQDAQESGAKIISGETMFLFQGMAQFEIFTGLCAPQNAMAHTLGLSFPLENFSNILQQIVQEKWKTISFSSKPSVLNSLKRDHLFYNTLQKKQKNPHLIAEIKPCSPTEGTLFRNSDTIEELAKIYTANGASAISVITDEKFFGGNIENMRKTRENTPIPILRKDFIIDVSQIYETYKYKADAVLLMRSILSLSRIQEFLEICDSLGLDALVETHTKEECIEVLEKTSARIIGINNRDFKTLSTDASHFKNVFQEISQTHPHLLASRIFVAESGIKTAQDIALFASNAHAVLVGTEILKAKNREEKVKELSGNI